MKAKRWQHSWSNLAVSALAIKDAASNIKLIADFLTQLGPQRILSVSEACDFESGYRTVTVWYWEEEMARGIQNLA